MSEDIVRKGQVENYSLTILELLDGLKLEKTQADEINQTDSIVFIFLIHDLRLLRHLRFYLQASF